MAIFPMPETEITAICRRYQVEELCLFGSAARGEMRPNSDIDLPVDFLPDVRPVLLGLSAPTREFSGLPGHPVDAAVKLALEPFVRAEVLADPRVK